MQTCINVCNTETYIYIYKLLNILKLLNPMHYRKFISVGMETPKPFW